MILDEIVAYKRAQIEREKEAMPVGELVRLLEARDVRDFRASICKENISIIAEIKRASPSKGIIRTGFDPVKTAEIYEELDVDAVSVLTEKQYFLGDDSYVPEVRKATRKPVLRKDFIVDEYQLFQSKALGADAVLLIASVLGKEFKRFHDLALDLGLCVLAEVHDFMELFTVLDAGCGVIGINNRDLKTFEVSLSNTEKLIRHVPRGVIKVSESGIKTPEDVRYLSCLGVDAVLIGETFMRNMDEPGRIGDFISRSRS